MAQIISDSDANETVAFATCQITHVNMEITRKRIQIYKEDISSDFTH